MGRKLQEHQENPIDNVMINLSEAASPWFKARGWTPNGITTLSVITMIAGLWAMWTRRPLPFLVLMTVSYFFDCLDGHFARKYEMVSKFGDYYDHVTDVVLFIVFWWIMRRKYWSVFDWSTTSGKLLSIGSLLMLAMMGLHMGCQENIFKERIRRMRKRFEHSETLDVLGRVAKAIPGIDIAYTKYFGIGSGYLFFWMIAIWAMA